ncbi:uncharacterized protein CEXT_431391 [Caerostris extrusa]|uniref:Ribosomal protein L6 n=1 Tax=Caerostris extrusa TaxID=172846 RepID=A0AAV4TUA8_CAEEX|nr:uncharacterized protein CEXT_431391 [Caerostris extrusa]
MSCFGISEKPSCQATHRLFSGEVRAGFLLLQLASRSCQATTVADWNMRRKRGSVIMWHCGFSRKSTKLAVIASSVVAFVVTLKDVEIILLGLVLLYQKVTQPSGSSSAAFRRSQSWVPIFSSSRSCQATTVADWNMHRKRGVSAYSLKNKDVLPESSKVLIGNKYSVVLEMKQISVYGGQCNPQISTAEKKLHDKKLLLYKAGAVVKTGKGVVAKPLKLIGIVLGPLGLPFSFAGKVLKAKSVADKAKGLVLTVKKYSRDSLRYG